MTGVPMGLAPSRDGSPARRRWRAALLALCLAAAAPDGVAADGEVRGRVLDGQTGLPLVGANVQLLETVRGTTTDEAGRFAVTRVPDGEYVLCVSMIGYATRTVAAVPAERAATADLEIELTETAIAINPVVVTADRRPRQLNESTSSLSVLSFAEIASRNNLRLDEALEMVPGVYLTEKDVSIRGSTGFRYNSGGRVLLLVDGIPVMTGDTGGIGWDMLPIDDIERVEVFRGAGSAVWGSSAIGGVINVITKRPTAQGALVVRLTGGLYDDPSEPEWVWAPDRNLGYVRTDVGYSRALGNSAYRVSVSRYASTGDRRSGDFEKWNVSAKISRRFADASQLEVYSAWLHDGSGVFLEWRTPFRADSTTTSPTQLFHPLIPKADGYELKLAWLNTYVKYSRPLSSRSHLRLRLSMLRSVWGNHLQVVDAFAPAYGPGIEAQVDWVPAPGHYVTAGLEAKANLVEGKYFGGANREYSASSFVQEEWQARPGLRLTAGLRLDRYELVDGPVNLQANPRLGVSFTPRPSLALRASAGRGFRVPTVAERSLDFTVGKYVVAPSDNLQPESSWSYEVGFRHALTDRWFGDIALFRNDYNGFIEPLPDPVLTADNKAVVRFQNVPDARVQGFELATGSRWWSRRLELNGSLTLLDHEERRSGRALAYRPRWVAQLSSSAHLGALEVRADYRYVSRLERVAVYTADLRVAQHDLALRVRYPVGRVALTAGVNNALNYNYTQQERNLGEIRSFNVGLSGRF